MDKPIPSTSGLILGSVPPQEGALWLPQSHHQPGAGLRRTQGRLLQVKDQRESQEHRAGYLQNEGEASEADARTLVGRTEEESDDDGVYGWCGQLASQRPARQSRLLLS